MKKILWLTTGGTIDAEAYAGPPPEHITARHPSGIPDDLCSLGLDHLCEVVEICHEDSKVLSVAHLDRIIDTIAAHPEYTDIRISLGTDALMQCETYIERRMQERQLTGRTVLFVAAMAPLANQSPHAWETLRKAVESAGRYPEGFYVIGDERSAIERVAIENRDGQSLYLQKDWAARSFRHAGAPFLPTKQ